MRLTLRKVTRRQRGERGSEGVEGPMNDLATNTRDFEMTYDSRPETYKHIHQVQERLAAVIRELTVRMMRHDLSKLESPEKEIFDEFTPQLAGMTYGSDEYKASLAKMRPAIEHHNANNRHHPEHFGEQGMRGMNLIDVVEMLCDWKAATLRHNDGDIVRSIEINQQRFGYSDDLKQIMLNTVACID